MPFYELRQYEIRPGKMADWLKLMEEVIIPFQVAKGMVIAASFRGEDDDSKYVWIRRFENEEERERLYREVYESDLWKDTLSDQVGRLINRETIDVQRLVPTGVSVLK
ncbi:MAG: NIPSNAP family protein [Pseudomonadota bacterium]